MRVESTATVLSEGGIKNLRNRCSSMKYWSEESKEANQVCLNYDVGACDLETYKITIKNMLKPVPSSAWPINKIFFWVVGIKNYKSYFLYMWTFFNFHFYYSTEVRCKNDKSFFSYMWKIIYKYFFLFNWFIQRSAFDQA